MQLAHGKKGKDRWYMLRVDTKEAIQIIRSLTSQLIN